MLPSVSGHVGDSDSISIPTTFDDSLTGADIVSRILHNGAQDY